MTAQSPLLTAKLSRPHLPTDVIRRRRLLDLLQAGTEQPLILVSAPAGYGKTTLVNDWLSTLDAPCAWLALDEFDDSLPDFVAYLCAAVATAVPHAGHITSSTLAVPAPYKPEQLADIFLRDLALSAAPLFLVLDDYHSLQSAQIHRFMERVVDRIPSNVHIVLIARSDPPLRLARLRVRRQLVELRSIHLCFTEEEAAIFLAQLLGAQLPPPTVSLLTERTEGWPAGLQLAAISLTQQEDKAAFAAAFAESSNQLVSEYLVGEVLDGMPAGQREFLLQCSILDHFCAALCDAVTNPNALQPGAQDHLEILRQRNLFLVALDGEGRWLRFHHLFRSLLRHHLERSHTQAEIAELHARAGRWFEAQGRVEEALRHTLAAGDELRAAQLVERSVHSALNREAWRELEQWLALLPAAVKQRPALLVAQAWLEHFRYRQAAITPLLVTAQHNLSTVPRGTGAEEAALMGSMYALSTLTANIGGTPSETLHASALALELLPPDLVFARGITEHCQVRAIMQTGDLAGAVHMAQHLLAQNAQPDGRMLRLLLALCAIYYDDGAPSPLADTASLYHRFAQQLQQPISVAWANSCLGWAYYQRNDLENAQTHFARVIDAHTTAHVRTVIESYSGLAHVLCAEHEYGQAQAAAERLTGWLVEAGFVSQQPFAAALAAQIELASGMAQAERLPGRPTLLPHNRNFDGLEMWVMPALVQVRLWLHAGGADDLAAAEDSLAACRARAAARNLQRRIIEIDALDALRCAPLGRREEALVLLTRSVTAAASRGALRLLLDLGAGLRPLLQELLARHVAPAFVRRLLDICPPLDEPVQPPEPADSSARVAQPNMLLTNRELDVLLLLAQRLTDKEIAAALFLSPRTVKKHSANIYQKLHVDNRRAAVVEARAIGILPGV
jgi:LuxR family maltose regulon positive regulatory protein